MRFSRCLPLAAALVVPFIAPARAELANGVKALVGDKIITYQQVEATAARSVELLRRQYALQPSVFQEKVQQTISDSLEALVTRELIIHEFKSAGYQMPENVIEEEVRKQSRERFGDRATLTKTLKAEHMTYDEFRERIREGLIIDGMTAKFIYGASIASPKKIEDFYNAHASEFKAEEEVKLRMIVLDTTAASTAEARKKLADEIISKLKDGATFSEMAAIYSTGSQRERGGDWGWVQRKVLRAELADAAFKLGKGEHSQPIETPEACYVLLIEDVHAARQLPLSEVRDVVEKNVLAQDRSKAQKEWIDRLKKKTFVRYF
ncbi:MAG: Peptidylprolyl isomerase [Verrucomicrobiota bacterium]|jgi:peptidyl-prolyl cis-trans isomerase SurA